MNAYHIPTRHFVSEDTCCPLDDIPAFQPFLTGGDTCASGESGPTPEQIALALAQVTAAAILPPLLDLPCGTDLLNYRVDLRDRLDVSLLRDLAAILNRRWRDLGWTQISVSTYLSVIGAGVAVCIDTTPGSETLCLRYDSELENELFHAGRTRDLPRSRLFLQAALHEKINDLLAILRDQTWHWLNPAPR